MSLKLADLENFVANLVSWATNLLDHLVGIAHVHADDEPILPIVQAAVGYALRIDVVDRDLSAHPRVSRIA